MKATLLNLLDLLAISGTTTLILPLPVTLLSTLSLMTIVDFNYFAKRLVRSALDRRLYEEEVAS
jgi:hypothetical protein